jgi:uncharacterized membrane-anchored protein
MESLARSLTPLFLTPLLSSLALAQEPTTEEASELSPEEIQARIAELDASLPWRTGEVVLGDGVAKLLLPDGYRYLDPQPSKGVLEDVWGNPPSDLTWGMIFPAETGPFHEAGWGVVLQYIDEGHVSDDDADEVDYAELLEEMQDSARDENEARVGAGFGTLEIIGWAEHPHHDAALHHVYWAKELQFGDSPVRTLNYDVRVLGREGVLSMNAVADLEELEPVRAGMAALLGGAGFTEGNRYEDYDSSTDNLAAYGIGGLIAGKVALKVGLFKGLIALLVAGKKLVIVAAVAIGAFFTKRFNRKKAEAQPSE